jgi:hypothetical protein
MKPHRAVYGVGIGINGREAAMQATQRSLDQLGTAKPVLALVFVSQEFNIAEVLAGLTSLLGETPLWGFSTTRPVTGDGDHPRSVVVALLSGAENKVSVQWFPAYSQDSSGVARQLVQNLRQDVFLPQQILLVADGINGSLGPLCNALAGLPVHVTGCMAAGEPSLGKTYQIGKNQAGPGSLTAAYLGGRFRVGVGLAHGWKDLGVYFRATRTRDVWVQTLDGISAAETYARLLGYTAREWAFPPLTDMARLYPLGVELYSPDGVSPFIETEADSLLIRSALRVEVDGSLRMSAPVPEGAVVHLMTGDPDACLKAAQEAARQALAALGKNARPILAVVLVDAAWQLLFEARPGALASTLKAALGELPVVGAYTFGQLVRPAIDSPLVLHNQNLQLLVFGEALE